MKKAQKQSSKKTAAGAAAVQAIVSAVLNRQAQILVDGQAATCLLPGSLASGRNNLVVGDRVAVESVGNGQYRLVEVLARTTSLYRGNRRSQGEEVLVAANAELLLAVVTADYLQHQAGFVEAAAIAAGRAGLKIGLFVSKWDLVGEAVQARLRDKLATYGTIAGFVFAGASLTPPPELAEAVSGKTCVLAGDRSSGKTALIHGILGALAGTKPARGISGTHAAQLHQGPNRTLLIDTPGFRDFALQQITEGERDSVFPEIAKAAAGCSFRSCTHIHEEGCAVLDAVRAKEIARERYDAWLKLSGGVTPTASKPDYRHEACEESFPCQACGSMVMPEGAGSQHRNHCPKCLCSIHVDEEPGDRASLCGEIMEPISVWVRKGGEWAIIHRCRGCGTLSSNRIAADDNPVLLMSIAVKPLAATPFPLSMLEDYLKGPQE